MSFTGAPAIIAEAFCAGKDQVVRDQGSDKRDDRFVSIVNFDLHLLARAAGTALNPGTDGIRSGPARNRHPLATGKRRKVRHGSSFNNSHATAILIAIARNRHSCRFAG